MSDPARELTTMELQDVAHRAGELQAYAIERWGNSSTTAMASALMFILMNKAAGIDLSLTRQVFDVLTHLVEHVDLG